MSALRAFLLGVFKGGGSPLIPDDSLTTCLGVGEASKVPTGLLVETGASVSEKIVDSVFIF